MEQLIPRSEAPSVTSFLSQREEYELIHIVQGVKEGDPRKALDELTRRNRGLIYRLAQKFANTVSFPFDDAFQEATIAFIEAIGRFDTVTGYRLSTYVSTCIAKSLMKMRPLYEQTIRIPVNVQSDAAEMERALVALGNIDRENLTAAELAQLTGFAESRVVTILNLPSQPVSLDLPSDGDCDGHWVDQIASPISGPGNAHWAANFDTLQVAEGLLALIDPFYADILRRRFGIYPYVQGRQSLAAIGKALGKTPQAILDNERAAFFAIQTALGLPTGKTSVRATVNGQKVAPLNRCQILSRNAAIAAAIDAGENDIQVANRNGVCVQQIRRIVRNWRKQQKEKASVN
jgi:RNA polymerase sigma factor (sigma-70 family)